MSPQPDRVSVDEARLLPRFRLQQHQASVFRAEYDRAAHSGITPTRPKTKQVFKAEPGELRGIPVIAPGVPGTQPGTNPATARLE